SHQAPSVWPTIPTTRRITRRKEKGRESSCRVSGLLEQKTRLDTAKRPRLGQEAGIPLRRPSGTSTTDRSTERAGVCASSEKQKNQARHREAPRSRRCGAGSGWSGFLQFPVIAKPFPNSGARCGGWCSSTSLQPLEPLWALRDLSQSERPDDRV